LQRILQQERQLLLLNPPRTHRTLAIMQQDRASWGARGCPVASPSPPEPTAFLRPTCHTHNLIVLLLPWGWGHHAAGDGVHPQ
jgi:hypothetical protein